jgi:uncharacterized membrane protein YphA (DoxX/SURF4 family)
MTKDRLTTALLILQWVVGVVLVAESFHFALSSEAAHAFAKTGLPDFVRQGLAWTEIAAALLFLIPRATWAGGWFLIVVLVFAIILHILHGWFDVSSLLVYIAATYAVMAGKRNPTSASREKRT